jgi:hypothetical protein
MKGLGAWTYRITMMLLAVVLIDFNCTNMKATAEKSHYIVLINVVLGGLLFLLLISQIIKKRL